MKKKVLLFLVFAALLFAFSGQSFAQLKVGYLNSQAILEKFKEAQDVKKELEELSKGWEQEILNMQREIQEKGTQLEAQRLLLSDQKRTEKETEIQALYQAMQKFQSDKWGPQGEILKEEAKLLQPIQAKIIDAINVIAEKEEYDYVFDTVSANIVYVSKKQVDLTERILQELETGGAAGQQKAK